MKKELLIASICTLAMCMITYGQDVIYGPADPLPGSITFTYSGELNDEEIGLATGKMLYFSNVELANTTDVYFSTLPDEVKLSLNGSVFEGGEILQFDAGASDPASGILIWTGTTTLPSDATTVYTKFTFVATEQGTATPVSLESPETVTGSNYPGGIIHVVPGTAYQINLRFDAGYSAGSMEPALTFYNNEQTTGNNAFSSYDYGWYWINDAPQVEDMDTLKVMEGDTACMGLDHLLVTDTESPDTEIFLTVASTDPQLPAFGTILLDQMPLNPEEKFTLAQLKNEIICYVHDDSETTEDSIALCISDGDGTYYSESGSTDSILYLPVKINPVNDPPVITVLETLETEEGGEASITELFLETVDNESDRTQVIYTLDPDLAGEWPKYGTVRLSGIPLGSGDQFTQDDIHEGRVAYHNDGSEHVSDGFIFTVEDGSGNNATGPEEEEKIFFEIAVTLVNDPPKLSANMPSEVDQWHEVIIDADHLAATDEESDPSHITFTLDPEVEVTQFGSLYLSDVALASGDAFTMQDIIDGNVKYVNDGSPEISDMIVVQISDEQGAIATDQEHTTFSHMFQVTITGIREHQDHAFMAYPNPGHGNLTMAWEGALDSYVIINLLGQRLKSGELKGMNEVQLDLTGFDRGTYLIKVHPENGPPMVRKIVLN